MTSGMKTILHPAKDLAAAKKLSGAVLGVAPVMDAHMSTPERRPVWRAGAIATVVGAGAAAAYGWLLRGSGVPMLVGSPGATEAEEVAIVTFAWGTAMLTIIATIMAVIVARRAQRPRHTFVVTTGALALISVGLPLAAGATASSTKLTFALGHIVLAAIIIPIIASGLTPARAT